MSEAMTDKQRAWGKLLLEGLTNSVVKEAKDAEMVFPVYFSAIGFDGAFFVMRVTENGPRYRGEVCYSSHGRMPSPSNAIITDTSGSRINVDMKEGEGAEFVEH